MTKKFYLNLNQYRNAHYHTLNRAKVLFSTQVQPDIDKLPVFSEPVELEYTLNPGSKRRMDIANVLSIVDKFFCDALVSSGKIPDDSHQYIKKITYLFGEVQKKTNEGHVLVQIK